MLITDDFEKIQCRKMSLEEAVKASNYKEVNSIVINKEMAHKALLCAIKNAKEDMALYILSKFEYTKQDIDKINSMRLSYQDVEFSLSDSGTSPRIFEYFIENGLVDVNKKFTKCNAGNTMLDNAHKFKNKSPENKKLFDLLLKHGAVSGKLKI